MEAGGEEAGLASAKEALRGFQPQYEAARAAGLRRKLGLLTEHEGDLALAEDLLTRMAANGADFTLTFRTMSDGGNVRALFANPSAYDAWAAQWRLRAESENLSAEVRASVIRMANPAFIPRNHLVEAALAAAVERQDFQPFEDLLRVGSQPYDSYENKPELGRFAKPALPEERVRLTFCGT